MKKIQLTLIQLDNYGPWTVTPPKPESYLQSLQSRLFADIEDEFSARKGLVFSTRSDNMLGISNGVSLDEHKEIQEHINKEYPITISIGIGMAEKPYEAQRLASQALQKEGSSRSSERKGILVGESLSAKNEGEVQIAHIDVNSSTSLTDNEPIYYTHYIVQQVHLALMSSLYKFGGLIFYMGGDNFMAPSNGLTGDDLSSALGEVEQRLGVKLKAGVGVGINALESARLASEGLHDIREGNSDEQIVFKS